MIEKMYIEKDGEYLKNNPSWHIEDSPWKAKQIIKMLERNPINPLTIAEVGCGAGEILNQLYTALPVNTVLTGYDISIDAIELAKTREKERLDFEYKDFIEVDKRYDLLLMMDVFEHVNDYLGFLTACRKKAKNTIFHIPLDITVEAILRNKLIVHRKSVGHIHYFTKETALATLVDSGYEIIDYFYTLGAIDLPRKTWKSKLSVWPKKIINKTNQDVAARIVSGYSLLVLAK